MAAAIGALAVNGAVASASIADSGSAVNLAAAASAARPAAQDPDTEITKECVQASPDLPDPPSWRPGVRFDLDAQNGFLVIRNDQYARVCVVKDGKGTFTYSVNERHVYGNLTAERPFDYLSSYNFDYPATESVHFGIVTNDVTAVSLVGPDKSVTPAVVRDGTFYAKSNFPESPYVSTTNYVRTTLKDGRVIEGPFRSYAAPPTGGEIS
ncbi:hypothetical protein [Amycolatopsis pigmentata]|uniref:Uncharacterized protein n=1 Tax=Amycolatopsis pigmentata TaxID=450801 RepID=A0ABW5FVS4_9PSEU